MNSKHFGLSLLVLLSMLMGCKHKPETVRSEIGRCFISFNDATNLRATEPEKLGAPLEKLRNLATRKVEENVVRKDGYSIQFYNEQHVWFVNLKIELFEEDVYDVVKKTILANLDYAASLPGNIKTNQSVELEFNDYKFYGMSLQGLNAGKMLGSFVMFPGDGVILYFNFNNIRPEARHFNSIKEYEELRDKFFDAYTEHLKSCMDE
jgi:hypothetical protein